MNSSVLASTLSLQLLKQTELSDLSSENVGLSLKYEWTK